MDGSRGTVAAWVAAVAAFCGLETVAMFAVFVAVAETNQLNCFDYYYHLSLIRPLFVAFFSSNP